MEQNLKAKNQLKSPDFGNDHIKQEQTDKADKNPASSSQIKLENRLKLSRKRIRVRGKRSRPPKRARLLKEVPNETFVTNAAENISSPEAEVRSDDVEFCLDIRNLPSTWSFMDVKNFIDMQCGPVDEIEMIKDEDTNKGAIRLTYQTEAECKGAMKKLQNKQIDGNKLSISMIVLDLSDSEMQEENDVPIRETTKTDEPAIIKPWRPDLDMWEVDPKGTYGLKETFLQSLDITPPIDKWVYVANFRCDKHELRDVLDMAGTVLQCSVFTTIFKYANVMYSHPLEAVQAVAILNGQTFYGHKLKVVMQRCPPNTVFLPKGLSDVGVGLGTNGKPLRSVIKHYQRYLTNQTSSLNMNAFEIKGDANGNLVEEEEKFEMKSVQDFKYQVPISETKVPIRDIEPDVPIPGTESPEPPPEIEPEVVIKYVNTKAKLQGVPEVPKPKKKKVKSPADSPMTQPGPQNLSYLRNPGPNISPKPTWSGPGPDPGMRPFGPRPIQGPRPMGPMQGSRPTGPRMQGPMGGPMGGPNKGPMVGPIRGPIQGPVGGPMGGPNQGPMIGPMAGPNQGPMIGPMGGPNLRPMGGPLGGPNQGPMGGPMGGPNQGPVGGPIRGPIQGPVGGPIRVLNHGAMGGPMGGPHQRPIGGALGGPNQRPMGGSIGGPHQGPVGGPIGGPNQGPMGGPMGGPNQGPMGSQIGGPYQGPMQGSMGGPMQGHMGGPMGGQNQRPMGGPMNGSMSGPRQGQGPMMNQMPHPMRPGINGNEPVQMQLSNLPPSTTFALLCEKMAACGQVVSIQLTTPGAAVVTFANRMQADNCYKRYNNVSIEGHMIQVKYS